MTQTTGTQTFSPDALAVIAEMAVRRTGTRNLTANTFGGFDYDQPMGGHIRVVNDDDGWVIYLMTDTLMVRGSHRLTGSFATPDEVAWILASLA